MKSMIDVCVRIRKCGVIDTSLYIDLYVSVTILRRGFSDFHLAANELSRRATVPVGKKIFFKIPGLLQ